LGSAAALAAALGAQAAVDDHQILWQRSLADALTLAQALDRPLLIAVNMDGESASDRIVHEEYRDLEFVAATRRCVCLVASVFRHSPRDHDDQGRRIPCPRLGEVTCGEHMALEPVLFERYLADGERVAPRHALVRRDGSKAFDLSLCFDLRDIDRALAAAVAAAATPATAGSPAESSVGADWPALAGRRDQRGRAALEAALAGAAADASLRAGLAALAAHGDAGALDALRILGARLPSLAPPLRQEVLATARALGLQEPTAAAWRALVQAGTPPFDGVAHDRGAALLPAIAALDGQSPATRSLLLACRCLAEYGDAARAAVATAFGPEVSAALEQRLDALGGPVSLARALQATGAVTRSEAGGTLPRANPIRDVPPAVDELERRLDGLEADLRAHPDDAALHADYGKACLDLGRRRLEAQRQEAPLLFQDAERHLARALEVDPSQKAWWIERARAAYFLADYPAQVRFGERALAASRSRPGTSVGDPFAAALLGDAYAVEALRWVGDGNARRLEAPTGTEPSASLDVVHGCLRALAAVAASPYGDAQDWTSLASACGALGLWHDELALLLAGACRLPTAQELRQAINAAAWNLGRIDLAPAFADCIGNSDRESADAAWFSGHARILAAEDLRRREQPELALLAYEAAAAAMQRAAALNAAYATSCAQQLAHTWLGRGFAHARAGRQDQAAVCLVRAVRVHAHDLEAARDGLGYDPLDLVDKVLEWRASGASPVDALELLDQLEAEAPDTAFWALAVADSELREALRADGRNPDRVEKRTVDAAGNPITMPMGRPTEEGDAYLQRSMRAAARAGAGAATAEDRVVVAQSPTVWAERMLERGQLTGVHAALRAAADVFGLPPPAADADAAQLRTLATELRSRLGEARPRQRPGR